MTGGALALLIQGGGDNWQPRLWKERFQAVCPGRRVVLPPDDVIDPAEVHYAAVWKPPSGALAVLPNLRVIFNLGAGVDALMADQTLPDVPVVRVAVDDLTGRMTEYVVLHVLMHHRQQLYLWNCQRERRWAPKAQWAAGDVRVGILGLGTLGFDAASALRRLGFQVAGWSRNAKSFDGIESLHGPDGLEPFLERTNILVCLLPLTPDTRHLLNRRIFSLLDRNSPLGAPVLINAGRGGLQVEADLAEALNNGTLGGASLDVFEEEPLPPASPLWDHPRVIITPHNAAVSVPEDVAAFVAQQIMDIKIGAPPWGKVSREAGY